jgi:hypothetical protein
VHPGEGPAKPLPSGPMLAGSDTAQVCVYAYMRVCVCARVRVCTCVSGGIRANISCVWCKPSMCVYTRIHVPKFTACSLNVSCV